MTVYSANSHAAPRYQDRQVVSPTGWAVSADQRSYRPGNPPIASESPVTGDRDVPDDRTGDSATSGSLHHAVDAHLDEGLLRGRGAPTGTEFLIHWIRGRFRSAAFRRFRRVHHRMAMDLLNLHWVALVSLFMVRGTPWRRLNRRLTNPFAGRRPCIRRHGQREYPHTSRIGFGMAECDGINSRWCSSFPSPFLQNRGR